VLTEQCLIVEHLYGATTTIRIGILKSDFSQQGLVADLPHRRTAGPQHEQRTGLLAFAPKALPTDFPLKKIKVPDGATEALLWADSDLGGILWLPRLWLQAAS